jgi:hypothetical protein
MSDTSTPDMVSPYLVLGQTDDVGRSIVEAARTLHDLIVTFPPRGHYSVRTIEDECGPAIHCAFEDKIDADRLAATVGAIEVARYENYRSERAFFLGDEVMKKLRRAMPMTRG